MNIINRIEYYRIMRGMTEEELGLAVGLSKTIAHYRITQYEEGKATPRPDMINRIASVLHVSPYDLSAHVFTCGDDIARSLLILEETGEFEIIPEDDQVCIRFVNPNCDDCQELLEALDDHIETNGHPEEAAASPNAESLDEIDTQPEDLNNLLANWGF